MAYPAPVDVGAVSGFECYLVFIPDDEAYLQAAWGAYIDLANQWNWGMDAQHEDSPEIEQHWLEAVALTMEELGVSKLDTIIGHIDQIEDLIAALETAGVCCDPPATLLPTETIPDSGYEYEGSSYPATWGDGETITSQADYDEVLCAMAHRYVDNLAHIGVQIDQLMTVGVITVSVLAGVLAAVSSFGLFAIFAYATASAGVTQMISDWVASMFTTASSAIETARDDIVCAFLTGVPATLSAEIEATISAAAWTAFFQFMDYTSPFNAAQTGEYNGEYIEIARNDTCDCGFEHDVTFDFNTDGEGFIFGSRTDWSDPDNLIRAHPVVGMSPEPTATDCSRTNLGTKAGIGNVAMYVDLMTLDVLQGDIGDYFALGKEVEVTVRYEDATFDRTVITAYGTTIPITVNPAKELEDGAPQWLNIRHQAKGSSTQGNIFMDNIRVGFHE